MKKKKNADANPDKPYVAPMGFLISEFQALQELFREQIAAEKKRKPSVSVYKATNIPPVFRKVTCKNETFAGQLIVLCAQNGLSAERRSNPSRVLIAYYKNVSDSIDWLLREFRTYTPEPVITGSASETVDTEGETVV